MKIIYADGTEETLDNDVEYSIYKTITTFDKIIKTPANRGFFDKWIGAVPYHTESILIKTVYNSQIKAIIP